MGGRGSGELGGGGEAGTAAVARAWARESQNIKPLCMAQHTPITQCQQPISSAKPTTTL